MTAQALSIETRWFESSRPRPLSQKASIEAAARSADVAVFLVHTFRSGVADSEAIERNQKDVKQFESLLRSTSDRISRLGVHLR